MEYQQFTDSDIDAFERLCDHKQSVVSDDIKTNDFCLNVDKKVVKFESDITKLNNANRILGNQLTKLNETYKINIEDFDLQEVKAISVNKTETIDQKTITDAINNIFACVCKEKESSLKTSALCRVYEMTIKQLNVYSQEQANAIASPVSLVDIKKAEMDEFNNLIEDLRNL